MQRFLPMFQIAIVGSLGNGDRGGIAIDDITITSSHCPGSLPLKTTKSTTPVSLPEPTFKNYLTSKEIYSTNSDTIRYYHSTLNDPMTSSKLSSTTVSYPLTLNSREPNSAVQYHTPNHHMIMPNSSPPSSPSVYDNFTTTESLGGTNHETPSTPNIINNVTKLPYATESALNLFHQEQDIIGTDVTLPAAIIGRIAAIHCMSCLQ